VRLQVPPALDLGLVLLFRKALKIFHGQLLAAVGSLVNFSRTNGSLGIAPSKRKAVTNASAGKERGRQTEAALLIHLAQFLLQLRDQTAHALRSFIVHRDLPRKQAIFHDLHFECYSVIFISHPTHGFRPCDPPTRQAILRKGPQSNLFKTAHRWDFIV
jgi:hypothetical protein